MNPTITKRKYKASFILDTRGVENSIEALIEEHLKGSVTAVEGEVDNIQNLGRQDFASLTDKNHPGDFYIQIEFTGPSSAPSKLKEKLRLEKSVKRVFIETLG